MNKLIKASGERTPSIALDHEKGIVEIKGKSMPENSFAFYKPILDWLVEYEQAFFNQRLNVKIMLDYFNTSSSKCILDILRQLGDMMKHHCNVNVTWVYTEDDEDEMVGNAVEYQSYVDYEIKLEKFSSKTFVECA